MIKRILTGACVAGLFSALYFIWFEPPVLSYNNLPFPALNNPKAGEAALFQVIRCNSDSKQRLYTISRRLIGIDNSTVYILPASVVSIEPGCTTEVSAANVIPASVKSGRYTLEGYGEIAGTLRNSSVRWYSQTFEVR